MADKVQLDVEVGGVEQSINSVKDLKKAIEAAKNEQLKAAAVFGESSKEFVDASKKVSALKDKVDDLADSTKSLKGSGVERASEGFNQLGEGLKNLDFDKVKVGLIAMKSALAAVGIGLIVQLVSYLIENFDELSKGGGFLATTLRAIASVVSDVIEFFTDLVNITSEASRALDKMSEAIKTNADKAKEALASQTAEYDRQIAIAKASGKSAIDLEIAKQEAIVQTNKALIEQTIAYLKAGGILTEEQNKLLQGQLEAIRTAKTTEKVLTLNDQKEHLDKYKTHLAEKKKLDEDYAASQRQRALEVQAAFDENNNRELLRAQKQKDDETLAYENKKLLDIEIQDAKDKKHDEDVVKNKASLDKQAADEQAATQGTIQLAQQSLAATQQLTDLFFEYKRAGLQKGSAEEIKAAEKQFKVNKALQIANAVVSGIQGVMAAYSSGSAIPIIGAVAGPAFAILAGIAAAANIAKIAKAKFNPGTSSAPSISGGGGGGAPSIPAPPIINTPNANTNQSTSFDESGKRVGGTQTIQPQINIKSTVSVSEINEKQNQVGVLEKQSTF